MLSAIEAINILFLYTVNNSRLKSDLNGINGGVYKMERPINSELEDVVINSLPLSGTQVQEGVLNINIYVKNLALNTGSSTSDEQPDTKRITELSKLAMLDFADYWSPNADYAFELENTALYSEENKQHYINLRIRFYSPSI